MQSAQTGTRIFKSAPGGIGQRKDERLRIGETGSEQPPRQGDIACTQPPQQAPARRKPQRVLDGDACRLDPISVEDAAIVRHSVDPLFHDPQPFEQKYFRSVGGPPMLRAARVDANPDQRLRNEVDVAQLRHPDPQVPVFAEEQLFVETAGGQHQIAPRDDRRSRSGKALAFQQIGKYVAPLARPYQAPRRDLLAAFVDTEISAVNEPDLWPIVSEQRHLLRQLVRPPSVVTVEEGDEGRAARLEGEVARVRGAAWLAGG